MEAQAAIQSLLQTTLADIRMRNPSYSMRAFSKKLGLSSSALSEILAGKRRVSAKVATRIAARLCLPPHHATSLIDLFAGASRRSEPAERKHYRQISIDQYHLVADWYHFAILSLSETEDFKSDAAWIAMRLNIPTRTAAAALERLVRLGMLKPKEDGSLTLGSPAYGTSDGVRNHALRASHAQNLDLARASLELDDVDERDFTSITMAIDPMRLPEAKAMIRAFRDRLCAYLESDRKLEVFRLCMQLIPLSRQR